MSNSDPSPVLVADDDELVREFLVRQLTRLSIPVVAVASAEEALARVEVEQFSALVLDVKMEGRSGLDLAEFIRLFGSHLTAIPIFIFTGALADEAFAIADRLQAEVYTKPDGLEALLHRIVSVMETTQRAAATRRSRSGATRRGPSEGADFNEPES